MDVLLKLNCPECEKMVIVNEFDVVDEELYCPHRGALIPVPGLNDDDQ